MRVHPYMQSWGYAIDNPYYAVTDFTGSFVIGDLPAGTYHVKAWHPNLRNARTGDHGETE
jgi:hypothetical protein